MVHNFSNEMSDNELTSKTKRYFLFYENKLIIIIQTIESYPAFDNNKLVTELKLTCKWTDFSDVNLFKFIIDKNLLSVFSESYKLIIITATIPITSAEAKRRSFSSIKRI